MYINFRDDRYLNVVSIYVVFVTIESFVVMIFAKKVAEEPHQHSGDLAV
jgi:hypothetical protein